MYWICYTNVNHGSTRDTLRQGLLADRSDCRSGDELANLATEETSSGQADFLGRALQSTDWTHCAALDCGAAWLR